MKILVVEDNEAMRDLLARILERMGYVPVLASHGKEGLEKVIAEKPNLIIMDMMMPVMDGWETARALRAQSRHEEYSDFGNNRAVSTS